MYRLPKVVLDVIEKKATLDANIKNIVNEQFVNIVGKLDLNALAAYGSAALSDND